VPSWAACSLRSRDPGRLIQEAPTEIVTPSEPAPAVYGTQVNSREKGSCAA